MHSTKVSFYEFPDVIRGIDILIGLILSFGLKYCWNYHHQIKEIITKNFTYIFAGTIQGMILFLYLGGSTQLQFLQLMGIGSVAILFQDSKILDRIIKKIVLLRQ